MKKPEHSVTLTRVIDASPAEVYAAWTEPVLMRKWFGTIVEADVRIGGNWRLENHEADGKIFKHKGQFLVLEPPHRLVISFHFDGPASDGLFHDEFVEVLIRDLGNRRTELTLTNGWDGVGYAEGEQQELENGWSEWLDRLIRLLRENKAQPP